ncbi:MAG: glycosyltransferase family 4 protein [Sedimentisphaerales bacterium]
MLNYEFPPIGGGAGRAHKAILGELAQDRNITIDVLTSAPLEQAGTEHLNDRITIEKIGISKKTLHHWRHLEILFWLCKASIRYRKLLRKNKYDLIHVFFGVPTGLICWFNGTKSIPYIVSLRGSDVPGNNNQFQMEHFVLSRPLKSIWSKAASLIACSEGLKKRALAFYPNIDISVIANGVDIELYKPAESPDFSERLKLITVGRLTITKRLDVLIAMTELLRKQGVDASLTIAGTGKLKTQLKELVKSRNLSSFINLAGRVSEQAMPELYRKHNLFVSATAAEGMSNAMLEAMASGLPIITTRCEGLDELMKENGIILEQPDIVLFANEVTKLHNNKSLYQSMAIAARKQAERFSWNAVANQYIQCYRNITSKHFNG